MTYNDIKDKNYYFSKDYKPLFDIVRVRKVGEHLLDKSLNNYDKRM